MQDSKDPKVKGTQQSGATPGNDTPDPDEYRHRNSGRRASGHGGGDMDTPEEYPEAHHEAGYEFSGGGRGHESNRSLAHESDEDLESRSGPYTRAGRPAEGGAEAQDKKLDNSAASSTRNQTKK